MEKTTLTVSIENEKLDALTYFLQSKEHTSPQKILDKMLQEMYEKYVPADTREYIDSRIKPATSKPKPKKAAKPIVAKDDKPPEVVATNV